MDKKSGAKQPFKIRYTLEQRKKLFQQQMSKSPEMIPVILERDPKTSLEPLEKQKYLSNPKSTLFKFLETVKTLFNDKVKKSQSLCFYVAGKVIENGEKLMGDVYKAHRDQDGFLYVKYGTLEAF